MKYSGRIKGVDVLLERLPEKYHHWCDFGRILELHFDYEKYSEVIPCIRLVLTDYDNIYRIGMTLFNVSGEVNFNITNGFYSGLEITDYHNNGCKNNFLLSSFEQDIDFHIYCESIEVELLD